MRKPGRVVRVAAGAAAALAAVVVLTGCTPHHQYRSAAQQIAGGGGTGRSLFVCEFDGSGNVAPSGAGTFRLDRLAGSATNVRVKVSPDETGRADRSYRLPAQAGGTVAIGSVRGAFGPGGDLTGGCVRVQVRNWGTQPVTVAHTVLVG